jgi:transcriptional regulator with XRE-family HTH domain
VKTETRAIKNLAKRVKELRLAKRFTQEECAARAEIATAYLSGLERGVRNPTVKVLARLAKAFEVPICALFEENNR